MTKKDKKIRRAEVRETRKRYKPQGIDKTKECDFIKREIEMFGHKSYQQKIRPLQDKLGEITERKHSKEQKNRSLSWEPFENFQNTSKAYQLLLIY